MFGATIRTANLAMTAIRYDYKNSLSLKVSDLSTPTNLKLNYLGNKYHAQTVACGSHFTMVVASSTKDAVPYELDEDCKVIQTLLRDTLQKH